MYRCMVCKIAFSAKVELLKHVKLHDGESLMCSICKIEFHRTKYLAKHFKKVHGNNGMTPPSLLSLKFSNLPLAQPCMSTLPSKMQNFFQPLPYHTTQEQHAYFNGYNEMAQQNLPSYLVPIPTPIQSYYTNHQFSTIAPHQMQHFPQPLPTKAIAMDHNTLPHQCHQQFISNNYNGNNWVAPSLLPLNITPLPTTRSYSTNHPHPARIPHQMQQYPQPIPSKIVMDQPTMRQQCYNFNHYNYNNGIAQPVLHSLRTSTPFLRPAYFINHPSTEEMPHQMQRLPPLLRGRKITVKHNTVQQQYNAYNGNNWVAQQSLPSLMISAPPIPPSYFTNHPHTRMIPNQMQQIPPPLSNNNPSSGPQHNAAKIP